MLRLAWFTPLPPVRSGISDYSVELIPAIARDYQIDIYVDGPSDAFTAPPASTPVVDAHDFVWKHQRDPYDLIVYQLGNAPCHDYMWAYLARFPGLVVLHDGQLHHARGRQLLRHGRRDEYRREFWFNHPDADPTVADLGVSGLLGSLTYFFAMLRSVVQSARHVLVHSAWLRDQIRDAYPGSPVSAVDMGVAACQPSPGAAARIRARHGLRDDAVIFMSFGKVTPAKRISEVIRALASVAERVPQVRLMLVGDPVEYYDPVREASELGVGDRVIMTGFLPDRDVNDYLAAADVSLCLRWPSSHETSASWLRCLAAGTPTISTDLVHTVDIPTLDPQDWRVRSTSIEQDAPVGVSIDLRDEIHSLQLAMVRLSEDARLRATLGRSARDLWDARFRLDRMAQSYRGVIDIAAQTPVPVAARLAALPEHFHSTGGAETQRILQDIGLPPSVIDFWNQHETART